MLASGDCSLITTKTGKTILIDGGDNDGYDYGENVVLPYLLKHGIQSLDYIMVSHMDSDHVGGLLFVVQNIKVKNIIIGYQSEETENFIELMEIAKNKKINVIVARGGDIIKIDKYSYFEIYFPFPDDMVSENSMNNNSLVAKLVTNDISILFAGDVEKESEEKLVNFYGNNLKSDILKVPHHGSKSSSTEEFLDCVDPTIALIGVGKNNLYGHPGDEVIERLENIRS